MANEREREGERELYVLYVLCDIVTSAGDLEVFVNAHRSGDDIEWAAHYLQKVSLKTNGKLAKVTIGMR